MSLCRFHVMLAALILLTVPGLALAQAATAPESRPEKFLDPNKLPFNTKVLRQEMKVEFPDWPKDSQAGAAAKRLAGVKIGLPTEKAPGVRFLKAGQVGQLDVAKLKSGLYLVGIDFVPPDLLEALKAFGYRLEKDGTLHDRNKEPLVAFVTSELYQIEKRSEGAKTGGVSGSTGSALYAALAQVFDHAAEAAHPFAWACYSFTPWAVYHGGFHRWYDARTWASAYGVDGSGGCSWASPLTNIDYISTRAAVGWPGNENHCFSCNSEYSRDVWDVGYFWPAHGIPTTTHSGVWADGAFSFSRSANLTW